MRTSSRGFPSQAGAADVLAARLAQARELEARRAQVAAVRAAKALEELARFGGLGVMIRWQNDRAGRWS